MKQDHTHNTDSDFFDYLSEIEQGSVTDADVQDLHQRIDKKVSAQSPKSNTSGSFSVVLVVGFTALLSFVLFNKKEVVSIGPQAPIASEKNNDLLTDAIQQDTMPQISTTTLPLAAVKKAAAIQEHFVKENMDTHFSIDIRAANMPSKTISLLDTIRKTELPENYLQLLPNAPVIYIYDLKVTDFQKLYFRKMRPFVITDEKWLSAQFENFEDYQFFMSDGRPTNDYTLDMLLKDALKLFNKQRYKQAFMLFNELLEYNENDVNALFYSALCQYYSGKYEDATGRLDKVLENENNVFDQESEWYKALSLLKNNDEKEAVTLLIKINSQRGFYAANAGEKLKELSDKK